MDVTAEKGAPVPVRGMGTFPVRAYAVIRPR